jgi:hypothetical protein
LEKEIYDQDRESPVLSLEQFSPEAFRLKVENFVEKYDCSYIEAVSTICDEEDVEFELIPKILKGSEKILNQIAREAEALNFIPKSNRNRLPI